MKWNLLGGRTQIGLNAFIFTSKVRCPVVMAPGAVQEIKDKESGSKNWQLACLIFFSSPPPSY